MAAKSKTALAIAVAVAAFLLLFFGGGTMMRGAMMDGAGMGGINWVWTSVLLVGVTGVVLFFVLFGRK